MQAGKLQRRITLQRLSETVAPSGAVTRTWATYAEGRAELRQAGISEFLTATTEASAQNAVFLIRWVPGVSLADRILHDGQAWNIVALAEIGRRRGLELRAVAA
ncbi:phage head closure protein [Phaeovulum vinaykumarii]|uniref:Phage head-tail adaptor, putative, SPP1 family n=1 Tax=Phaeovulum vinaykumarii TaxID=407234 RepID=A0A1N7K6C8_9RHOB|nr:phage head closure protein [Phaeovulum vinaykumarii]SIS57152.1 phage head-tail adaptor, putative, SPP1 family [Phaeovulum vinaykumarii]SOB93296.1 SPP1 family predicted phage head-tail adaptor [Phaeovulum vinaykumarii]